MAKDVRRSSARLPSQSKDLTATDPDAFGTLLRKLRESRKMSQESLAQKVGITQAYLSRVEKGTRLPPSKGVIDGIARELGASAGTADELRRLARVIREAARGRTARSLNLESVAEERARQMKAAEVWVVAESPLELDDPEYRNVVVNGLGQGHRYVYWTSSPERFDELRELLRNSGASKASLLECVICIHAPSAATWFSFVLHDPRETYLSRISGYVTREAQTPVGEVIPFGDWASTTQRILNDLRAAYRNLVEIGKREYADTRGSVWKLYYPAQEAS